MSSKGWPSLAATAPRLTCAPDRTFLYRLLARRTSAGTRPRLRAIHASACLSFINGPPSSTSALHRLQIAVPRLCSSSPGCRRGPTTPPVSTASLPDGQTVHSPSPGHQGQRIATAGTSEFFTVIRQDQQSHRRATTPALLRMVWTCADTVPPYLGPHLAS